MTKPWARAGNWALDAELAEAEERELAAAAPPPVLAEPAESFPSLREATATKSKKKKGVKLSLSDFVASPANAPDEPLILPTGPKLRSAEDLQSIGGGFRSYGPQRDVGGGRRPLDEPRGPPRSDYDQPPSKADESDNWAREKKFTPSDTVRTNRYTGEGRSFADEVDNWTAVKKPLPSRPTSFSTYRDSGDYDRWTGRGGGGSLPHNGERPMLVLDPPKRDSVVQPVAAPATARPSPFGAARPREEVLREKGLDPLKVDSEIEAKMPTSSHSSRPSSAQSSRDGSPGPRAVAEGAPKARVKVNPFGDAKPREIRLQEQGIDWRKLDLELEHRGIDRPETEEEKLLKEDINELKVLVKEIEGGVESTKFSAGDLPSLNEQICQKEIQLEALMLQLDDKTKFRQRSSSDSRPGSGSGRPGSGSGRRGIPSDRPPSQSGRSDEFMNPGSGSGRRGIPSDRLPSQSGRSDEFINRPRSRGSVGDGWRSLDDRRGFQGDRERAFLGDRNMDRPRARAGW